MSVIVMGMDMPNNCHVCVGGYGGFCAVAPAESDGICPDQDRPDWCPLRPLPEKHGRLIDIDDLCSKGFFVARVEWGGVQWSYSEDDFEPIVEAEGE